MQPYFLLFFADSDSAVCKAQQQEPHTKSHVCIIRGAPLNFLVNERLDPPPLLSMSNASTRIKGILHTAHPS